MYRKKNTIFQMTWVKVRAKITFNSNMYVIKLDRNYNNVLLRYVLVMAGSGNLRVVIEKQ